MTGHSFDTGESVSRSRNRSVFSQGTSSGIGFGLLRLLLGLVALILIGGVVALGFVDIEPPTEMIEKVVPPDRFLGQ